MTKFWRVVSYEYTRHVLRKRFLFGLLSVPGLIALMVLVIVILVLLEIDTTPIGYVDYSGLLAHPVPAPPVEFPDRPVPFLAFADEDSAQAALEAKELAGYYLLSEDYLKTGRATLVYYKEPKSAAQGQFRDFLLANLLQGQTPEVAQRLISGSNVVIRSADGSREMSSRDWFNLLLPLFGGMAFFMAIFSTAGYIMQAIVEEKENRTMEILVTSISPEQLMVGKIVGIIGVGLTQILAWVAFIVAGVWIGGMFVEPLRYVHISSDLIVVTIVVMVPCFVMLSGLMAMIGATVTEAREGQQIVGLISFPVWVPYMLAGALMGSPNSPLAVGLSLFPLTAPMSITLRMGFTIIPLWQIALSTVLLILSAIGSLWLAGRAFRLGMLSYGKRLSLRQILGRKARPLSLS